MTNVKIIYNPIDDSTSFIYENYEITSPENKIYASAVTNGFRKILMPFSRRYVIWNGLLPELINEFNDGELNITFEGRQSDFEELQRAFRECEPIVESIGYENEWTLTYIKNYETEVYIDILTDAAENIKDMCETNAEITELDAFRANAAEYGVARARRRLGRIIDKHIQKWQNSDNRYKMSKIHRLKMIEDSIDHVPRADGAEEVITEDKQSGEKEGKKCLPNKMRICRSL